MSHYSGSVPDTSQREPDWRAAAACRDQDPERWFPKGDSGPWLRDIEQAKAICERCPSMDVCLQFALTEGIDSGIFGGLTEQERRSARRAAQRRKIPLDQATAKARKPTTLRGVFDANTTRTHDGHLTWTSAPQTHFRGETFTAKQLSFYLDRGRRPDGKVTVECGVPSCVLPQHIADFAERSQCGTRAGYQRHRRNGQEACARCREANADADNRPRRTSTTKAAA